MASNKQLSTTIRQLQSQLRDVEAARATLATEHVEVCDRVQALTESRSKAVEESAKARTAEIAAKAEVGELRQQLDQLRLQMFDVEMANARRGGVIDTLREVHEEQTGVTAARAKLEDLANDIFSSLNRGTREGSALYSYDQGVSERRRDWLNARR